MKLILVGPRASGKTTLARMIAKVAGRSVREVHSVEEFVLGGRKLYEDWPPIVLWDNAEDLQRGDLERVAAYSRDVIVTTTEDTEILDNPPGDILVFRMQRLPAMKRMSI